MKKLSAFAGHKDSLRHFKHEIIKKRVSAAAVEDVGDVRDERGGKRMALTVCRRLIVKCIRLYSLGVFKGYWYLSGALFLNYEQSIYSSTLPAENTL